MALPTPKQMTDSDVTESQFKSGINSIIDFLEDLNNQSLVLDNEGQLEIFHPAIGKRAKTLDSGKVWYWNGSAWVDTGLSELDLAKADATTKANTAKIEAVSQVVTLSSNLFNAETITKNKTISSAGILTDATNFACSDFIQVSPNTVYYFDGFRSVAFYDENKVFVSRTNVVASGAGTVLDPNKYVGLITTGANIYFIRVNYNMVSDTDYIDGRKININASAPYEKYANKLKEVTFLNNSRSLADKVVTKSKVDFIQESKNFFNAATAIAGKVILDTGVVSDNAGYALSDFIAVKGGEKYTISSEVGVIAFVNASYYDVNKQFIRRVSTGTATALTFRLPEDVAYVRFNINLSSGAPSQKNRMFNVGETALPYEAWHLPRLVGVEADASVNPDDVGRIIDEKLAELPSIDDYIARSYNLFNAETCTIGKAINATGQIIDNAGYAISDFIAVKTITKYTTTNEVGYNAWIYTVYYDANKNFISRITTASDVSGFNTIETPANVAYVRFSINLNSGQPNERERMFVEGDSVLPYKPYRTESLLPLAPEALKEVGSEVRLNRSDNFIFDYDLNELFTTSATLGSYLNFNGSTSAQVYQMYDDLVTAHPNHITKQNLGNDAWGNPIALYRFKAPQPVTAQGTKTPKVFLTTGVHGMEHVAVLTAYLMFEQMMNNWKSSKLLEVLRNNVEFLIIPVCNPSGYNKYTRKNDNGVDLNRNFPDGFGWQSTDPSSPYYGGASPLDQLESQYIVRIFNENPDIDVMYDFHNFNGTSAASHPHLVWIPAYTGAQYVEHMTQSVVRKLTNYWRNKFTWIPQSETWFAGYSDATEGAMIKDYAAKTRGIPFTATFEVGGKWWIDPTGVPYDLNHKQSCLEALVNFMLINLNELKRI